MNNYTLLRKVMEYYTQKDLSSPENVESTLKTFSLLLFSLTLTEFLSLFPEGDKQTACTCILIGKNRTGSFTFFTTLASYFSAGRIQ